MPVDVPPETPIASGLEPQSPPRPRLSKRRLALAFALAALADGLSVLLMLSPPVRWTADVVTAILLFIVLGWQWILLPGLIMEAVPGLDVSLSGCSWWGPWPCGVPAPRTEIARRALTGSEGLLEDDR